MQTKSRPIELLSPAKDLNCGIAFTKAYLVDILTVVGLTRAVGSAGIQTYEIT